MNWRLGCSTAVGGSTQLLRSAGKVRSDFADALHEVLTRGGDRPVAGGSRGLVGEVGEAAEVVDSGAEGGERGPGGLCGTGKREGGPAARGRTPVGVAGGGTMAEGALAGQVAQQTGQMADFVVQDLAQGRVRADLVGERELVGHGVEAVGHVVQQHPLVRIGQQ
ncbi:hypothetical protein OG604_36940 [Streptomyces sp. NBC_01231]|nr:hypothetical protein OG604_36940 [Streptomyces sp. NBC_01231]